MAGRRWVVMGTSFLVVLGCLAIGFYGWGIASGIQLENAVAGIPTGIPVGQAVNAIGSEPDEVRTVAGTIVNSVTFYSARNPKAAAYGKPSAYEVHTWRRGGRNAAVVVDRQGVVAAAYTWN